jgi:hypothetical protein
LNPWWSVDEAVFAGSEYPLKSLTASRAESEGATPLPEGSENKVILTSGFHFGGGPKMHGNAGQLLHEMARTLLPLYQAS